MPQASGISSPGLEFHVFRDVWKSHNKHCKDCRQTFSVYWNIMKKAHADKIQTHSCMCIYVWIYIYRCLYVSPCMVLCSVSLWVFTELREVSPDSWNLSSWRDCSDVAGPLLLCCPFPFYWHWCLLRSPRAAWGLQFSRSRINLAALFSVGITRQSSLVYSNIRKIKHLMYCAGVFQSKVKGWLSLAKVIFGQSLSSAMVHLTSPSWWALQGEIPGVITGSPSGHNLECWAHL